MRLPYIIVFLTMFYSVLGLGQEESEPIGDTRTPVYLTPEEMQVALGEMRLFVESLNGIFRSLSKEDYVKAAFYAEQSGMVVPREIRGKHPDIINKLPIKMKLKGMLTHKKFDLLAKDLRDKVSYKKIMDRLGKITNQCVYCHRNYRLVLE